MKEATCKLMNSPIFGFISTLLLTLLFIGIAQYEVLPWLIGGSISTVFTIIKEVLNKALYNKFNIVEIIASIIGIIIAVLIVL